MEFVESPSLWNNFSFLIQGWQKKVLFSLVFFFPILTATVKHAGSTIYAILTLMSFFYLREGMKLLNRREKRFLLGFAFFCFFAILSLFMTEDLRVGVQRLERYARFLVIIPIYCMMRVQKIETAKAFLSGSLVALFVMFAQGYYQVNILHVRWAFGGYNKIIWGNSVILFSIFIFVSLLFHWNKRVYAVFATIGVASGLYAGLLSGCRTAWLFIPVIIICMSLLYRKRFTRKNWKMFILGIALGFLFIGIAQPDRLKSGLEGLSLDANTFTNEFANGTAGVRLVMWRNSLIIFKDSPIFGTGMGDFMHDSIILLEKGLSYKNGFAAHSTNAHNIYFMLLAEGGLVGLTLLVLVFFIFPYRFVYALWKETSDKSLHLYTLLAMISLLAFAWFGVSESWINRNTIINAYCLTFLVFVSSAANRADKLH